MTTLETKQAKKWLARLAVITISILMVMALAAYYLDPFFAYRARDKTFLLNPRFVVPGLIKNHDYDTAVIGSSMIQNFSMPAFREHLKVNPLKATSGGISISETLELYQLFLDEGKAKRFYINIDIGTFASESFMDSNVESIFPGYLMDRYVLNDYQYLLGYEAWMRFIPVSLAIGLAEKASVNLPEKFLTRRSIDRIAEWKDDFSFSRDIVLKEYAEKKYAVSQVSLVNLSERMTENIDLFISRLDLNAGEHIFFFPPYSALYWFDAMRLGYFEYFQNAKDVFIKKLIGHENVRIFDFQNARFIVDLNHYKDTTHYSPDINEWMIECFASGQHEVKAERSVPGSASIEALVNQFMADETNAVFRP
ncbi:MAG TPA: hypothetical protein PLO90_07690 [Clostridia bacterium]|nr:hypothetical protein [Clostridia bacterium]HQA98542.1 hypothetical protein [Clostridia bacterium]